MDARYRIRRASQDDASALAEIERRCFTDPWTQAGIRETIQYETAVALLVEKADGTVIGYLMARISREEGEILNLAVLPEHRRRGIARELLEQGLALLAAAGVREAFLEVRESNHAAITLYGGKGFRSVGMRPHYYRSPTEDALVLRAPIRAVRE